MNSQLTSWLLALRPKTLTAAIVPVVVATALVKADGHEVIWWVSICAVLSAVFIQIGTNFVNDAIDFHKGADTDQRIGPKRVTQSGLLSSKRVMAGAFVCFAIALALGIPLVVHGGWPIVMIGLVSLAMGYAYTGGPFPLAYKGLGDFFVIVFFGLIAVMGTYYLHTGFVNMDSAIAGLQVGLLATVLIAINNLRDAPQDALVGKKTLAVRFGVGFARVEIAVLAIVPFVLGLYWSQADHFNAAILPIVALPFARRVVTGVFKNEPSPIFNRFLAMAAGLHLFFGLFLSIGLWVR
ncbi:MAG: 1,4-dihydroxy-2-naphthoate polyprenyltransferase [Bdellovibrionota bacterium]